MSTRKTENKRVYRKQGEPYFRLAHDNTKDPLGRKRWCIRFGNKEYGYPKYLAQKAGIDLKGKRVVYKSSYDWINPPTLNDIEIVSNSDHFKTVYIHNYPPEIQSAIHSIIELSKKINHELRNNTY